LRKSTPVTQGYLCVFGHPDHIRHVLINNHQKYTKGIGEHFAMVEMTRHTARLAQHTRVRYLPQQPVELTRHVNLLTNQCLCIPLEQRR
jgi:cytochrome P450